MTDAVGPEGSASPNVRKFNPGTLQSDREIIDQFAVRQGELEIVLDVLRGNLGRTSCQHALVVAPRGRGKTMLLARTAAELRRNKDLARSLLPVRFMEESHEITDVADFWLEALFHLARESAAARPELAAELRATHASLCERWRERALGDLARAAVLNAADRLDRRLVLMVENLQALSANADADFGWQLRAVLQSEPKIMLLASATSRFERLDDAQQPFFELFRVIDLKPLTTDQCCRLWASAGGDRVTGRQIRPLEILTGGSPRLLVIVAGYSRHRSLRQLMEELVMLVDEHTEYFRGHLEVLPKGERRVYVAVIDLWRPSSAGEISARARMDVRTVSTMLGRLADRGAVTRSPGEHGRRRLHAAAEPLYSIYYKLRRERDEAAVVEGLVHFMMAFYDPFTLYHVFEGLWAEARESPALHRGIERALAMRPMDADLGTRMTWDHLEDMSKKVTNYQHVQAQRRLQEETKTAIGAENWRRVIELVDQYVAEGWDQARAAMQEHESTWLALLRADAYLGLREFDSVTAIGTELLGRFRGTRDVDLQWRSGLVLLRKAEAHARQGDFEGAIASTRAILEWFGQRDDPQFGPLVAEALLRQAEAEKDLGRLDAAASLLDEVVARFGDSDEPEFGERVVAAMVHKADVERLRSDNDEAVAALYDVAVERGRALGVERVERLLASALMNRALVRAQLGDFEGEIASYRELLDLTGDSDAMPEEVCLALGLMALRQAEIGLTEEALRGCTEAERRVGDGTDVWASWIRGLALGARATVLTVRGETGAAIEAFRAACAALPARNELSVRVVTRLTLNLLGFGAAERDLMEVLASASGLSGGVAPLVAALRKRCGEPVRVPAEVLAVAQDIAKQIEERVHTGILTTF